MSVVGFDFGNHKCVVSVARKRGIDVLQNEVGHRVTPSIVAFSGKQRFMGNEALSQQMSNPKGTCTNFKRLLGKQAINNPDVEVEKAFTTYNIAANPQTGRVEIEVPYDDSMQSFSPEQITGALFTKLKSIAEAGLEGQKVSDCCIACPPYFTECQRAALLDAANVASLNVLKLMNETTAVALNYGILRPLPKDKHQLVLFYDMGHSSTNVALVAFSEGKLEVRGQQSEPELGGRNFDDVLVRHFVQMIKDKYKMDVSTNVKSMLKLRKECERVKLHLSANSKVQFSVEYIMNDTDVSGVIERSEFEQVVTKELLPGVIAPIEAVLAQANVKKEDLHSVEVIGGSVRIPIVQRTLNEWLGRDVNKTCDGDESVARGCALMCAMISPSFRVREFEVQDAMPFPIELAWGKAPAKLPPSAADFVEEDKCLLFTPNNPIPSVKLISFNDRTESFEIVARYVNAQQLPPAENPVLGRFIISGVKKTADGKAPKIKVRVKLDTHGLLKVMSAYMIEEIQEQVTAEDNKMDVSPARADNNKTTDNGNEAATEAPPANQQSGDKMDTSPDQNASSIQDSESFAAPTDVAAAAAKPVQTKTKSKREDLKLESFFICGVDQTQLQAWFEKEVSMAAQDRAIFETNEARNALEAYVLEMRNRLSGDLSEFVAEADRNRLNDECNAAEEWVYGDGSEAQKSEYKQRLNQLKLLGDVIVHRHYQATNREHHVALLKAAIGHYQKWCDNKEEKYAHITTEERQQIRDECAKTDKWLTQQLVAQDKHPKHENPLLTIEHLDNKKQQLEKFAAPIVNKKKPAPKPEPKKEEAQPQQAAPQANAAEAQSDAENQAPNQNPTSPNKQEQQKAQSPKTETQTEKPMDTSA